MSIIRDRIREIVAALDSPVVVELGAHRGTDTRWLREACKGTPVYIAVEPDPRHLPELQEVPGVIVAEEAVASYTGAIEFHLSDGADWASSSIRRPKLHASAHPEIAFDRSVAVPCITLDDLAEEYGVTRIDLLWADIQGAEKDMVLGGQSILRNTDWIFVESYRTEMYEGQALRDEFLAMLPDFEVVEEDYDDVLLRRKPATMNVVIFSKNRAMQLDALLRSIARCALSLSPIDVLYLCTEPEYQCAYDLLAQEHPNVVFHEQSTDFKKDLLSLVYPSEAQTVFLVDDDVFYRPAPPVPILKSGQCFSFRLGMNVVRDHLTGAPQSPGSENFCYSYSLDGHVFRTADILPLIQALDFGGPNQLESFMEQYGPPLEVLHDQHSSLVGIPHNAVQTEFPNVSMGGSAKELNNRFLAGERIDLDAMDFSCVDSTHCDIPYTFKEGASQYNLSMRVSVVIPNKNYGRYLATAIESCLEQRPRPHEVIVVDSGSTDRSLAIAACYPVTVLQGQGTQGAGKNQGIEHATGEHIICLDSDDRLAPGYIEACLAAMKDGVGIVSTGIQCFGDRHDSWNPPAIVGLYQLLQGNPIFCASMFRKQAWLDAGKFDEKDAHEDWDLWIRSAAAGWKVAVVPEPLFHYRSHSDSITREKTAEETEALNRMIRERYAHLLDNPTTEACGMTIHLPHERDRYVVDEVMVNDCYWLEKLAKLIPAPQTIVDVGGNIGTFGLKARSIWPKALLVAYEPNKKSAALYRRNMEENGLIDWTVIEEAVSYESEKIVLAEHKGYATGGGILATAEGVIGLPGGAEGEREISETAVRSVTMEAVADLATSIDLLKLDCEGSEIEIIKQMKPETAQRIGFIVGEYHIDGGYPAFEKLVRAKFPWFNVMPLGGPKARIGNFAAGPLEVIAKLREDQDVGAPQVVITPLGNEVHLSFNDGARVDIVGHRATPCTVRFENMAAVGNARFSYTSTIPCGHFAAANAKYRVPWRVVVEEAGVGVMHHEMDLRGKRVLVVLTSSSLGDTVAWMPYADELRQQFGCTVEVETFWPDLFDDVYPEIKFHKANTAKRETYYATYLVGAWEGDGGWRNRAPWRTIPLQQIASDTLGLEYREIRPKIKRSDKPVQLSKYVAISEFSAFQVIGAPERAYSQGYIGKHWPQERWQEVVDHLEENGYAIISVSKEPTNLRRVVKGNGDSIEETIRRIQHADCFIGVSSGLTWVAWALGVPVVCVSGMTETFVEMQDCWRVINEANCHGCFNDLSFPINKADPAWCPRKHTCSTAITVRMVQNAVDEALRITKVAESAGPLTLIPVNVEGTKATTGEKVAAWEHRPVNAPQSPREPIIGLTGQCGPDAPEPFGLPRVHLPAPTPRRILMICPHLSTGGQPQYALWCVRDYLAADDKVQVIEWNYYGPDYVVQRKQIEKLCQLVSFGGGENKAAALSVALGAVQPDVVHLQEYGEYFLSDAECAVLYRKDRPYRIVETSHCIGFDPYAKQWLPDEFSLVSPHHMDLCIGAHPMIPCHFNPYKVPPKPRPDRASALVALGLTSRKRHVLNVGLFTPGKNQGEVFEIARRMPDVQFHFVGNQAVNFAEYWQPLMANKSANCNVWGERDDVDRFYAAMDLLLFVSKAELAPLVPVEALAWGMPVLMRRLPIYQGAYDGKVTYLLENGFYNTGMQVRQALDMGAK